MDPAVQSALVAGGFALVVALISFIGEMARRQGKAIQRVQEDSADAREFSDQAREHSAVAREQVQNSHSTNLRDDLDTLQGSVNQILQGQVRQGDHLIQHSRDIANLSRAISHEQTERTAADGRLNAHLEAVTSATAATVIAVVGGANTNS